MARDNIRNFCIIAHIDHGKSTLSDRILELTKSVDERTMEDQILDNMDIERERGITIKARAVTMNYTAKDGKTYEFNLIDTPGHVDFAYEVSRSLAACEGAILVVDATQGVEAQTLANTYMALEHDLELVPILNKIDLPSADPDAVAKEVEDVIGLPCLDAPRVSAKTGLNIDQVLERVVSDIPARLYPVGRLDKDSEGLLLMTNDGAFAQAVTHPSGGISKLYRVTVQPRADESQILKLSSGVVLDDGVKTQPAVIHVVVDEPGRTVLEITLHEGRNRQIRRMCEAVGLEVIRLKRSAEGPVKLGMLQPGEYRELKKSEISALRNAALKAAPARKAAPAAARRPGPIKHD